MSGKRSQSLTSAATVQGFTARNLVSAISLPAGRAGSEKQVRYYAIFTAYGAKKQSAQPAWLNRTQSPVHS